MCHWKEIVLIIFIFAIFNLFKNIFISKKDSLKYEIKLNSNLNNKTVENDKTIRIFCMILTQNSSLYNNKVNNSICSCRKY